MQAMKQSGRAGNLTGGHIDRSGSGMYSVSGTGGSSSGSGTGGRAGDVGGGTRGKGLGGLCRCGSTGMGGALCVIVNEVGSSDVGTAGFILCDLISDI
ncbi:hypothetical protein Ahia01_001018300 [Argonauta hians]